MRVRLAYATSGDGPALVKAANWLTHLDYDWASPVWSPWWRRLSQSHRSAAQSGKRCRHGYGKDGGPSTAATNRVSSVLIACPPIGVARLPRWVQSGQLAQVGDIPF
jgi:hypothetical protein